MAADPLMPAEPVPPGGEPRPDDRAADDPRGADAASGTADDDLVVEAERLAGAFPESALSTREANLLARLERDLARVLGAGVSVEVVERLPGGSVRLVATCLVEGRIGEIEAVGRGVAGAAQALVRAAAERRLEGAFWRIIGPPG
ncbi:MAG: hypothetical protein KatS3mg065_0595 [Chloroflexota bacterium]|nr:MAG: hypothetical protein KatS3mg065_0595 [Chloroflexota bacterium]